MLGGCGLSTLSPVLTFTRGCVRGSAGLCTGPAGTVPTSDVGRGQWREGAPWGLTQVTSRASCLREALAPGDPGDPGFRTAGNLQDRFECGGRPNGMQAWSGLSGHVALLAALLAPKAGPTLTTHAAMLLTLTQFMSSARSEPNRGCTWPTSIPLNPHLGLSLTVTQTHTDPM